MSYLNLFPTRVPIGYAQQDGTVLMTPEFSRALSNLVTRVGGENGSSSNDIEAMAVEALVPRPVVMQYDIEAISVQAMIDSPVIMQFDQPTDQIPEIAMLMIELAQLQHQVHELQQAVAISNASMLSRSSDAEQLVFANASNVSVADWERPGKIGFRTPNSASVTTLTASGAVALSPSNANVVMSPTGTGVITISPAALGSMDKVTIGGITPAAATVTTMTALNGFGCNSKLAQTAAASGGAMATTGATNVTPYGFTTAAQADSIATKLNTIQAALIANGIMS